MFYTTSNVVYITLDLTKFRLEGFCRFQKVSLVLCVILLCQFRVFFRHSAKARWPSSYVAARQSAVSARVRPETVCEVVESFVGRASLCQVRAGTASHFWPTRRTSSDGAVFSRSARPQNMFWCNLRRIGRWFQGIVGAEVLHFTRPEQPV